MFAFTMPRMHGMGEVVAVEPEWAAGFAADFDGLAADGAVPWFPAATG